MARKRLELFQEITTEKDFYSCLKTNQNQLIIAEIYCDFAGQCTALDHIFQKIKFDWSNGEAILLRVLADAIEALERFRGHSMPVFMFIRKYKVTIIFRGVNSIKLGDLVKKEIHYYNNEKKGIIHQRKVYELNEVTPEEDLWYNQVKEEKQREHAAYQLRKTMRQAARKRHRAISMIPYLQVLNFVLFWPHSYHAHPELYELWVKNDIVMIGREEIQLTKEEAEDIFYQGDAALNEASLQILLSGPALAICFRLLDKEKHFVSLVRQILYEDLPAYDETKPLEEQPPRVTAFDMYKSYSFSKEEILRKRREEKQQKRDELLEKRALRLSEMQRLARQARDEAIEAKKQQKEQLKLELLRSGNVAELEKLKNEPADFDDIDIEIPEELPDELEEEEPDNEDPNEYFPPAGLLIPGFYSPPNDISKTNALAFLFPKLVSDYIKPPPEYLPPHILVMVSIQQRHKAIELMKPHQTAIIHMGIFRANSPHDAKHIAYSVKQYDWKQDDIQENPDDLKLVFMISTQKDLPVLTLMDLHPVYVSRDSVVGEEECAVMFHVEYGNEHPEFEDFDEVVAEEYHH